MQPRVRLQRHGMTGCQVSEGNKAPPKRGQCGGWSEATVRRNIEFLRSVAYERLTGVGIPFTFTLRDCPDTPEAWTALRRRLLDRFRYHGMVRLHWVTEWQRRGVPHLHGCVYFEAGPERLGELQTKLLADWVAIARGAGYRAAYPAQYVGVLWDALGWAQYVSKHAARGVRHYQRSPENMPSAWRGRTGRMWGYAGDWPRTSAAELDLSVQGWFALRRLVRQWRLADARGSGNRRRIAGARRMLKHSDPDLSRLRGWSEWIPEKTGAQLLAAVASRGYEVTN